MQARLVRPERNLGYGAGANLGVRHVAGELVFICNPDLVVEPGTIVQLSRALKARPDAAVAGPMLMEPDGSVYPSGRSFPSLGDALGHGFLARAVLARQPVDPAVPSHRRESAHRPRRRLGLGRRLARPACRFRGGGRIRRGLLHVRRGCRFVLATASCRLGRDLRAVRRCRVHEQGLSTSRHPYRMLVAHHRSILRFARRSTSGLRSRSSLARGRRGHRRPVGARQLAMLPRRAP